MTAKLPRVSVQLMANLEPLQSLEVGQKLLVGGNRVFSVDAALAEAFSAGDSLHFVEKTGQVLHVPGQQKDIARKAVEKAATAFSKMGAVTDQQIDRFFNGFAERLANDAIWASISETNEQDVAQAKARGRSTTRLVASETMRGQMIAGLQGWVGAASVRGKTIESVDHGSWKAELIGAELGVIAFVFEGRPNVVADATGVLRGGNSVVFRIGRDALQTAQAILELATAPALKEAGLPEGAVSLVESSEHAAGWALFSDPRLALAVARGSGKAVDTLGGLAKSAGVPVSLHGTGGAWLALGSSAAHEKVAQTVADCLDRKVCNTLNTCCIPRSAAAQLIGPFLDGLGRAAQRRNTEFKLHVSRDSKDYVPAELFSRSVTIGRAEGPQTEPQAQLIDEDQLGREWEWEDSPEVTLKIVDDLDHAVALFNEQSPQFVACLQSEDPAEHELFWSTVNAPFVGDGFTRWVDGQYALNRPELGLSNWENGRLFGRGGVLSGDSVYSVRTRVSGTSAGKPPAS